jgi:hypothetical protein
MEHVKSVLLEVLVGANHDYVHLCLGGLLCAR